MGYADNLATDGVVLQGKSGLLAIQPSDASASQKVFH